MQKYILHKIQAKLFGSEYDISIEYHETSSLAKIYGEGYHYLHIGYQGQKVMRGLDITHC